MNDWIGKQVAGARWIAFAISFAVWFAYNLWAINLDSPWTRALKAGGGSLPEARLGFPPIEPQRSLDALQSAGAVTDYLLWQALDIPYALLVFLVTSIPIALALRASRLAATPLRFLLLTPLIYIGCELVENALVAAFAAKIAAPTENLALIQQAATSLKLISGYGSMALALLSLAVALLFTMIGALRKNR